MLCRVIVLILLSSLLLPVYAEDTPSVTAQPEINQPLASPSAMEKRIRAYRESFDKQQAQLNVQRIERQGQTDTQRAELSARQQAMKKSADERREFFTRQQVERQVLMDKWREARQKHRQARMETYMRQREERLAFLASQQEMLRNRAEDEYSYLAENKEKILAAMLVQKIEIADRYEAMRKQADDRRKKIVSMRTAMQGMSPEERRVYIEEHREDLFGAPRGMPRRWSRQRLPAPPPPQN